MTMKKNPATSKAAKKPKEQQNVTIGKKDFLKKVSDKAYELSGTGATQKTCNMFSMRCARSLRFSDPRLKPWDCSSKC